MAERREQENRPERVFVGTGLFWGFIVLILFLLAVVMLAAQNPAPVQFRLLTFTFRTPLVVIILGTALVTALLTELIGLAWRSRRRRALSERAELSRLRTNHSAGDRPLDRPTGRPGDRPLGRPPERDAPGPVRRPGDPGEDEEEEG